MLKKIQEYLLLHYPLVWNIRIVPMLIIIAGLHLLFFGIGYLSTSTTFNESYYYSSTKSLGLLYFLSVLIGILLLVGWLVFYNRNNGFRYFYPRKTIQVYMEWIMIFMITTGIALIPVTMFAGHLKKWQSVATKNNAENAIEILEKTDLLIPARSELYTFDASYQEPIPIPDTMDYKADTLNNRLYSIEYQWNNNTAEVKGYIGASLLFYSDYNYSYYYKNDFRDMDPEEFRQYKREQLVKGWLRKGEKDSIYATMKAFDELRKKHKLKANLTPEEWFNRIYNPPFFPVKGSTAIMKDKNNDPDYYTAERFDYDINPAENSIDPENLVGKPLPFLPHEHLEAGYKQVLRSYDYMKEIQWIILFCLCSSLVISCFIFSFRLTKGKSWLIAFISTGILIFVTILLAVTIDEVTGWKDDIIVLFICLLWITLFIAMLVKITGKIRNEESKGCSETYMNLFIWLIPCIIPLIFFFMLTFDDLSHISDEETYTMFWINIPVVIMLMWPISLLIRNWKSISDQK